MRMIVSSMKSSMPIRCAARRALPGVTLVEMLAVMIVISLLMGLVIGIAASVGRKQDVARAQAHLT